MKKFIYVNIYFIDILHSDMQFTLKQTPTMKNKKINKFKK